MLRTMMKSKIHRATVTQADNKVLATGFDPAKTCGDPSLTRGDAPAR